MAQANTTFASVNQKGKQVMRSHVIFREYIWLVNTIHKFRRISLEDINREWLRTEMSEGVPMARSTFNRHKNAIEEIFGIYIECDRTDGYRYYIGNAEVLEENTIQNWMLSTLSVNNILAESKSIHDRILLESIPSDGEKLHKILKAIKRNTRVQVRYKRYGAERETNMTLEPYCVKLFNRRWYVLMNHRDMGHFITLSVDRILEITLTDERFEVIPEFDASEYYSDCYGILNDDFYEVETIRFRAYGQEVYFQRDLPFHHSQRAVEVTDEYTEYELKMKVTTDFITPLLGRGPYIKVISPDWLVDQVRVAHLAAARLYQ